MEYLALALFLSVVLFLIDKNNAWRGFWHFSKWAGVAALTLVIAGTGYYSYQQHQAKNAQIDFSKYENAPVIITPDEPSATPPLPLGYKLDKPAVTLDMSTAQPIQRGKTGFDWSRIPEHKAVDCYDSKGHLIHDKFAEKFGGVTTACAPGETATPIGAGKPVPEKK